MRSRNIGITGIAAGLCLIANLAYAAPAPVKICVPFDDLQQIHKVSNTSAVATTRRATYMIIFRASCSAMSSGAFFIVNRERVGQCLDAGDVLDASDGITCVVSGVSELPAVAIKNGPK